MTPMKYTKEQISQVLKHTCYKDAGYYDGTYKSFLADCLKTLWEEGEGFSGKRPICDSGWEEIDGAALAILEPNIGDSFEDDGETFFEVKDQELYQKTFEWLIDYIFFNLIK